MYQSIPSLTIPSRPTPRNFFKWLVPHSPGKKTVQNLHPWGRKNRAKTPPPGPLFSLKSSKKNTKHETENGTEMLTDV